MADFDRFISEVARTQDGLITRDQLSELGVSDDAIQMRLKHGLWQRLQSGVYLVGVALPTWHQKLRGICLMAPALVAGSHRAAAFVHSFDGARPGPLDVLTDGATRIRPVGALVHQTDRLRPEDLVTVEGILVTSVARTLLDYGAVVPLMLVERGVESMIRRGKVNEDALRTTLDELGVRGRRGVARLRKALGLRPAGGAANGYLEVLATHLDAVDSVGLVRQFPVVFPDGEVVDLDWAYPDVMLDIEWDGDETHRTRRGSKRDLQRDKTLRRLGWTVRRFSYVDVRERPAWVASEILAMLHTLRSRLARTS